MLILVIGGSGSGKSEYAEGRCVAFRKELPESVSKNMLYIATMEPYDEESFARIARHQKMRSGKGFDTLECYTHLEEADLSGHGVVLLECMSNLVANEMFSPQGRRETAAESILKGVQHLTAQAEHVVIVTNQVFSDGIEYDPGTMEYLRVMAQVNNGIAAVADETVEVVHGIPVISPRP